jgi:hypothetical protein
MANVDSPATDWVPETVPAIADRVALIEALPVLPALTQDEQDAIDGAASPSVANVFATIDDLAVTLLVRHAAGVPSGAPTAGEAPIAFDSTASTGGLYFWDGAAWVKGSTIP